MYKHSFVLGDSIQVWCTTMPMKIPHIDRKALIQKWVAIFSKNNELTEEIFTSHISNVWTIERADIRMVLKQSILESLYQSKESNQERCMHEVL